MDYINGKIYVIRNHINDLVYVGSTTQSLSKRFSWHKSNRNCKKNKKYIIYQSFDELGIENFYIEIVELYPCSCKEELCKREGQYIRKFDSYKNGYNMRIAGRTQKEYNQENQEKIKEQKKIYREANKEYFINYHKKYIDEQQKLLYIVNI